MKTHFCSKKNVLIVVTIVFPLSCITVFLSFFPAGIWSRADTFTQLFRTSSFIKTYFVDTLISTLTAEDNKNFKSGIL